MATVMAVLFLQLLYGKLRLYYLKAKLVIPLSSEVKARVEAEIESLSLTGARR